MTIPVRYRRYFEPVIVSYGYRKLNREVVAWRCRQCEKDLMPNTAGAQSHLAKHLREALSK